VHRLWRRFEQRKWSVQQHYERQLVAHGHIVGHLGARAEHRRKPDAIRQRCFGNHAYFFVSFELSFPPQCSDTFTGTFRGDTLTLTSDKFNNQLVTVNAIGSGNSLTGTYSVAGGCADGDNGTIAASYLPTLTGTWTGTLMNPDGTAIPIDPNNPGEGAVTASLTLTQSATATNGGGFPLSGTFSTNFACFASGTIPDTGTTTGASVMGTSVVISAGATDGEKIVYVGVLDEVPLGSANVTVIEGRLNLCGLNVLLNLGQQR
jgi:hypothetical protein